MTVLCGFQLSNVSLDISLVIQVNGHLRIYTTTFYEVLNISFLPLYMCQLSLAFCNDRN